MRACIGRFLFVGVVISIARVTPAAADLILEGGVVYTMDGQGSTAEAIAVTDDRIVYVGDARGVERYRAADTRVIDLDGATVLPGLVDAHAHLMNLGRMLVEVNVTGTGSAEEVRDAVRRRQRDVATGVWVLGRGWDQNDWTVTEFPTWRDLAGTEANPVCLRRVGGHTAWVNKKAMEVTGLTSATKDPAGGRIMRDAGGNPTGVLVDAAMAIVYDKIPKPSMAERRRRIELGVRECQRFGLTGIHDAETMEDHLAIYKAMYDEGKLDLRIYAMVNSEDTTFAWQQIGDGPQSWGDVLTVRAVKLHADGALGSRGAALLDPYSDEPGFTGLVQASPAALREWTDWAIRNDFQVATHCIGDAGNRMILDLYEEELDGDTSRRFRIEHAQVIAPGDIERFVKLGVIASMQPTHATSDMYWAEDRVGPVRIRGAYAWRSLMESGCVIACGSDFPVEAVNPLWGIYAAVTRQDREGRPEGGWYPEQRMTMEEAVMGFTLNAAYAEFAERQKGTIEIGKLADFTILDRDIMSVAPAEILDTSVLYTIVGGRVVYAAAGKVE